MLQPGELGLAWRAARHYRPHQLVAFGFDRAARRFESYCPLSLHKLGAAALAGRDADQAFLAAWGSAPEARLLAPRWRPDLHGDPRTSVHRFLGLERQLAGPLDWDEPDQPELWRYMLHYMDVPAAGLAAQGSGPWAGWWAERLAAHWERWRPGRGVAWKPYPLAVRLQNLLRSWAFVEAEPGLRPARLIEQFASHTRAATLQLAWRLEHQLGANHLLRELCALALGARVWKLGPLLALTLAALERQVGRQFGSGGGHEERSPRYHLDLLRDLIELETALGDDAPAFLRPVILRGLDFAAALEHPDGDVPLFNDSQLDRGIARSTLSSCVGHVPEAWSGLRSFDQEGFVVVRLGLGHLVLDCGPFGAPNQPAHAHCGALSFEYSWDGVRRVVNRGTKAYGQGPERRETRSTAFHSTVQLGVHEQAELWRGFRLGRRGRPRLDATRVEPGRIEVRASFRWPAPTGALHRRTLILEESGVLQVEDRLERSPDSSPAVGRFFLPGPEGLELGVEGARLTVSEACWYPALSTPRPGRLVEVHPTAGRESSWATRFAPDLQNA